MNIPDTIKVGSITYKVIFTDSQESEDNGECNQGNCTIKINKDAPRAMQEKVFWHELAHAWNITWEEETVESIAQMITTITNDNHLYKEVSDE